MHNFCVNFIYKQFYNSDITTGPTKEQCLRMARNLEFEEKYLEEAGDQIMNLYALLIKMDATQIEVNPFGVGSNGKGKFEYF